MSDHETYLNYVQSEENIGKSFAYVNTGCKNLVVSFGSANRHGGFDRKTSLCELKHTHGDLDILYLRDVKIRNIKNKKPEGIGNWYIGGLSGIGKNINHTIYFLKKIFEKYENVICMGTSMGGYASILFGSILNVNCVIVGNPQTDLDYIVDKKNICKMKIERLMRRKLECKSTWKRYANLAPILTDSVIYAVYSGGQHLMNISDYTNSILHSIHHINNIKNCNSVVEFECDLGYKCFISELNKYLINLNKK